MTKFNPAWQLVRVNARKLSNYKDKIAFVMDYLNKNPNKFDFSRVHNWLVMTAAGYKKLKPEAALAFLNQADIVAKDKDLYNAPSDNDSILSDLSFEELNLILNDLRSRKYGFQFKKIPQDHIHFVRSLEQEIKSRHS